MWGLGRQDMAVKAVPASEVTVGTSEYNRPAPEETEFAGGFYASTGLRSLPRHRIWHHCAVQKLFKKSLFC